MGMANDERSRNVCKLYIILKDYPTFSLENAVCNHGFFMMAPNVWDPSTKSLSRPLRLCDSKTCVNVTISKPPQYNFLLIQVHLQDLDTLSHADKDAILVRRMLRLSAKDENVVQEFQKIHPEAQTMGFGRIFRAPSLFEDVVKSILLCFCNWENSLRMAKSLCDLQLELSKGMVIPNPQPQKKRSKRTKLNDDDEVKNTTYKTRQSVGNFPSAEEVASLDLNILQYHCNLGLRAFQVHKFAADVHNGKCQLSRFETFEILQDLHNTLMKIDGFGYFLSANVCMCLGFYENVPADTETIRHLKEVHGTSGCTKNNITTISKAFYQRYAPFQCLAYWVELAKHYEIKLGKLSELPRGSYALVTGSRRQVKKLR